jgi:thiamine biosynthesis lipoprotein
MTSSIHIEQRGPLIAGHFSAMASPCEILIETQDQKLAKALIQCAADEAWRVEAKFSRYRADNIVHDINTSNGTPVEVDEETASLLDFAQQCFDMSDGMFDITSGVLRRAWSFDCSDRVPEPAEIEHLLEHIGWQKLEWKNPFLTLPENMQVDFGGIGKEYAVDKTLLYLKQQTDRPLLVNFGGDLHCSGPREHQQPWTTGIEHPERAGHAYNTLQLFQGALATSGDVFRYLEKDGIRYSHVLNPKTGWSVSDAPHSVTVAAQNCTEAGMLATLAMLHGQKAEEFLQSQEVKYWIFR